MVLDAASVQVMASLVMAVLLGLHYVLTYRPMVPVYGGWWGCALAAFSIGTALSVLNGTAHQVWAVPAGNALVVAGAAYAWAGSRYVRKAPALMAPLILCPVTAAGAAIMDDSVENVWAGGAVYLALTGFMVAAISTEWWLMAPAVSKLRTPVAAISGVYAAYCCCRCAAFLLDGPNGSIFNTAFGTPTTTVAGSVLVLTVTFALAVLGTETQTRELGGVKFSV